MSVSLVVDILPYRQIQVYLELWMIYLFEFLWKHSWDVGTLVPNEFEFLTLISNISVLPRSNLLHLNTIVSLVGHLLRPLVLLLMVSTNYHCDNYIDIGIT